MPKSIHRPQSADAKKRLIWPDAAKGFCIFLVVLYHLTTKHYIAMGWDTPPLLSTGWQALSQVLGTIRMPLFFAISGYFVARYLTKTWKEVARKRIITLYYLYLVWFFIHTLYFSTSLPLSTARPETLPEFFLGLILGYTSLWYLYALPVYFSLTKLGSSKPVVTLVAAALLAIASGLEIFPAIGNSNSLLRNFLFFAAAAYFPQLMTRIAKQASWRWVAMVSFGFFLSLVAAFTIDYFNNSSIAGIFCREVVELMARTLGTLASVGVFSLLSRTLPPLLTVWVLIGKRTLPVYVLHLPILALMNVAMSGVDLPVLLLSIYPLVASVFLVAACLALHKMLLLMRLNWLFSLPSFRQTSSVVPVHSPDSASSSTEVSPPPAR
ncbi:acyltransferase family protein [Ancrocorticia populi]|uniref:acyltransferase family protein n=1 Tax=Ancrocorticia populi TaxID=2175228 RepID=UPI003F9E0A11